MKKLLSGFALSILFVLFGSSIALSTAIVDLNGFYLEGAGSIALDGRSATLLEDSSFGSILADDPYYGTTGISTDSVVSVSFNYTFTEPVNNEDQFYATIYDVDDYDNPFFEADITESGNGLVVWDFAGIDLSSVTTLGIEFQLNSYEATTEHLDSTLVISDLMITTTAPVPEPSTFILLGIGLFGVVGIGRKRIRFLESKGRV